MNITLLNITYKSFDYIKCVSSTDYNTWIDNIYNLFSVINAVKPAFFIPEFQFI